ncbi:MAG: hypothetical protein KBB11_04335 [Bacteroidales bacterium]|nr:hypothetical protein [Bacteroidales bacterium]HOY38463.1 hypothetical protein [Bacteroidales bacterium]HQP04149.1 hypothetical protein [Bacteroidales bacterium]
MKNIFAVLVTVAILFGSISVMAQSKTLQGGSSDQNNPPKEQEQTVVKNTNCEKTVVKYEKFATRYLKIARTFELNPKNKALINSAAKLTSQAATWGTRISSLTSCGDTYQQRIKAAQKKVNEASKIIQKLQ